VCLIVVLVCTIVNLQHCVSLAPLCLTAYAMLCSQDDLCYIICTVLPGKWLSLRTWIFKILKAKLCEWICFEILGHCVRPLYEATVWGHVWGHCVRPLFDLCLFDCKRWSCSLSKYFWIEQCPTFVHFFYICFLVPSYLLMFMWTVEFKTGQPSFY